MTVCSLVDYLTEAAARFPDRIAVEEPGREITFADLDTLSSRVRDRLSELGAGHGDRVGICIPKSIDAYAVILGTMKAGAAYVPLDAGSLLSRAARVAKDCDVRVVALEASLREGFTAAAADAGAIPAIFEIESATRDGSQGSTSLKSANTATTANSAHADLAYVLYTSGSTGAPKGIAVSHRAAIAFVEWCSSVLEPGTQDRFSSHAPFHFDLSILDLYVPLKHAATVVLIPAALGREPIGLAQFIAERRLTVWYSTPTILTMLDQFGKLRRQDCSALRLVLFAGEVFPVKHLRALRETLPRVRLLNLYGPTETNVCTWHEIPNEIEPGRTTPYPIGRVCSHFEARVVDGAGADVPSETEGELIVSGDSVMTAYWNQPDRTADAFRIDSAGRRWYRTGDIVTQDPVGVLSFVGRRDRMVKRRGYRIELAEIEAGLYRHHGVREAAVVAATHPDEGVRIIAHVALSADTERSELALRRFCTETLPAYMIPDRFVFRDSLPKTSTDKLDYRQLAEPA